MLGGGPACRVFPDHLITCEYQPAAYTLHGLQGRGMK